MALDADPAALALLLKAPPPTQLRGRIDPVRSFTRLLVENLMVGLLVLTVARFVWTSSVNRGIPLANAVIAVALVGYAIGSPCPSTVSRRNCGFASRLKPTC